MGSTHSRLFAAATAVVAAGGCLSLPTVASATATLAPPSAVHVSNVTSSSFSISSKARNATRYKVFASTLKRNLYVTNLAHAKAVSSSHSTVTIRGLRYSTSPYYYRVEAFKGTHHRYGAEIGSVGLKPAVPTDLTASVSAAGVSLRWTSGPATGFQVIESTSPAYGFDQNGKTYTITGLDRQFSPPDLTSGTKYYFEVRALNGSTGSAFSSNYVSATPMTSQQTINVMTYNLLINAADGTHEGDGTVARWMGGPAGTDRVHPAAALVESGNPDVVSVQEGAPCANGGTPQPKVGCVLQVDSLVDQLNADGFGYTRANTEVDPPTPYYHRTGVYILYKTAAFTPVGTPGYWTISPTKTNLDRVAVYQILKDKATGSEFLMIATHLIVGNSTALDNERKYETNAMVTAATEYAKKPSNEVGGQPLPIVYAGDFNSDLDVRSHPLDGPMVAMRSRGINSTFDVATSFTNPQYNSANQYYRRPPMNGYDIDYVWAPPGVAVTAWHLLIDLKDGKFVGPIPSDHNPVMATVEYPY